MPCKPYKLDNWTLEQEQAFQDWLQWYRENPSGLSRTIHPVPERLIRPFRKGMRDRRYTPEMIRRHRGLLPEKS